MVYMQRGRRQLRRGVCSPQLRAARAPALVVADAEQHHEVFQESEEHEDGARDQPHLDAFELERVGRVCAVDWLNVLLDNSYCSR